MEVRLQSEDRAHRIGQKDKVLYIDFVCPNTLDEKIMKTLNTKKKLADQITGDNWKELFIEP
jgi:SNF2 family DNA or RNA helicase